MGTQLSCLSLPVSPAVLRIIGYEMITIRNSYWSDGPYGLNGSLSEWVWMLDGCFGQWQWCRGSYFYFMECCHLHYCSNLTLQLSSSFTILHHTLLQLKLNAGACFTINLQANQWLPLKVNDYHQAENRLWGTWHFISPGRGRSK